MTAALYIYLANVLTNLDVFLSIVGGISLAVSLFYTLAYAMNEDKYHGKNYLIILPLLFLFLTAFIPKERTMWLMAGAVMSEKVIDSNIGKQTIELIELKLKGEIDKLKEKKENK